MDYLGISTDEVLFVGDGENDINMFENLQHTVCMANGLDNLKSIAEYVTVQDNNNSGVAEAVKKYV